MTGIFISPKPGFKIYSKITKYRPIKLNKATFHLVDIALYGAFNLNKTIYNICANMKAARPSKKKMELL
ncbi:hypothetical protein MASR1M65_26620 [Saprospiraceae bacterium]